MSQVVSTTAQPVESAILLVQETLSKQSNQLLEAQDEITKITEDGF